MARNRSEKRNGRGTCVKKRVTQRKRETERERERKVTVDFTQEVKNGETGLRKGGEVEIEREKRDNRGKEADRERN